MEKDSTAAKTKQDTVTQMSAPEKKETRWRSDERLSISTLSTEDSKTAKYADTCSAVLTSSGNARLSHRETQDGRSQASL